jgi:hypothetical protein
MPSCLDRLAVLQPHVLTSRVPGRLHPRGGPIERLRRRRRAIRLALLRNYNLEALPSAQAREKAEDADVEDTAEDDVIESEAAAKTGTWTRLGKSMRSLRLPIGTEPHPSLHQPMACRFSSVPLPAVRPTIDVVPGSRATQTCRLW